MFVCAKASGLKATNERLLPIRKFIFLFCFWHPILSLKGRGFECLLRAQVFGLKVVDARALLIYVFTVVVALVIAANPTECRHAEKRNFDQSRLR